MKKFGFTAIIAAGLGAAVVGLGAPAQAATPAQADSTTISAGVDHLNWLDQVHQKANAPKVDTSVRHSGAR